MWRADKIQEKLGWEPGIPKLFSRRMNVRDERARHGATRGSTAMFLYVSRKVLEASI